MKRRFAFSFLRLFLLNFKVVCLQRGITVYVVLSYVVKAYFPLRLFLLVRKISASVVQCVYCH